MKRGAVGGMPSRVKLPPPSKSAKMLGLTDAQAALFEAYSRELRRWPGISAREGMENAARNMQRLMLKPPY